MAKKKVQQFCFEIPVDVELMVKVKVEGAANEQEAQEYAEEEAQEYARNHASEVDLGTIWVPDAEVIKKLAENFGVVLS